MRLHALLLAALLLPSAASAHLAGGTDVTVNDRILDFGFDPAAPAAGQPLTLAFNAADAATRKAVAPDSVWVRIADDDTIVFAGTLKPAGANVTFSAIAPDAGTYDVAARYAFGDEQADGNFILTVAPHEPAAPAAPARRPMLPLAAAAAAGAVLGAALRRPGTAQPASRH
jgi:hypothetical protein